MMEQGRNSGQKCLICSCIITTTGNDDSTTTKESSKDSNDFSSSSVSSSSTTGQQFHRHLYVIFILRNILELPVHQLASHLQNNGDIQDWISLCDGCDVLVAQCRTIFDQLVKISKKFKCCQQEIIKIVRKNSDLNIGSGANSKLLTANYSDEDKKTNNNIGFVQEIRKFVVKNDYQQLFSPLENTRPWTCPDEVKKEITPQNEENLIIKTEPDEEVNDWSRDDDNFNNENSMEASGEGARESEEDEWQPGENTENEGDEFGCEGSEDEDKVKKLDGDGNKPKRKKRSRRRHQNNLFSCPLCQVYKKKIICEKSVIFICFHLDKCLKRYRVKNASDNDIPMLNCGSCSMYSCSMEDISGFANHLVSCIFESTCTPLQHRIFHCNICPDKKGVGERYLSLDGFLSHYSYHHRQNYECTECGQLIATTDYIHAHWGRIHKDLYKSLVDYSTCAVKFESRRCPAVPWWCRICGNVFMEEKERDEHFQSVHPLDSASELEKKTETCQYCEKIYYCSDELKLHQATAHTFEFNHLHKCDHCCDVFVSKNSLLRHRRRHEFDMEIFGTNKIGLALPAPADLRLVCPVEGCGKVYRHRKNLKDHIASHGKKTVYPCSFCGKEFYVEHILKTHEKHAHSKNYQCGECPYETGVKANLKWHQRLKHPAEGVATKKRAHPKYKIRKQLEKHKRQQKNIGKAKDELCRQENTTNSNYCETDGSQIPTGGNCETESSSNDVTIRQRNATMEFICQVCGRAFKFSAILKRHQESLRCKQLHMSMEEATVVCHLCGGRYSNNQNLEKHIREKHERIHKVACEHCGKGFYAMNEYKAHLASAHQAGEYYDNKERFKCPVEGCGKILFSAKVRSVHIKHHEELKGEPQFKCEQCGKAFSSVRYRYMHVRTVHQGFKYKKKPKSSGSKFVGSSKP